MHPDLNLSQRYLEKVGFKRDFTPTLETLNEILILHIQNIPFGNLDAYLNIGVSIDPQDIAEKLLDQGREGYCLEQNILTQTVLTELGFEAFNLLGRVYYQNTHMSAPPRTHLITIVQLEQQLYLFDPGFGGMTPTGVLALEQMNQIQETPFESFRLIDVHDAGVVASALTEMKLMLQAYVKDTWINVYAFNPEHAVAASDIALANCYVSTSPKSLFTNNLMFSTIQDGQRKSLNNHVMRAHGRSGSSKQELVTVDDYQTALSSIFNINTEAVDFVKLLEKLST